MKSDIKLSVSRHINVPTGKVWEALTTPSIIKQYFFGTNTVSDWKPGSPLTFSGEWQGKTYQDKGTILENEPGKLLKYKYWSSMSGIEDKPENYVTVTFKVAGDTTTDLIITQENIPDEKTKTHSENNWNLVLDNLQNLLED